MWAALDVSGRGLAQEDVLLDEKSKLVGGVLLEGLDNCRDHRRDSNYHSVRG